MDHLRFEANEQRAKMILTAVSIMRGTAGGLPARRVDNRYGSTLDTLYWVFIRGHVVARATPGLGGA